MAASDSPSSASQFVLVEPAYRVSVLPVLENAEKPGTVQGIPYRKRPVDAAFTISN